jgi:nucleoside-diphosphate-sugar epimerase
MTCRLLVTGASGLIGRQLVRVLRGRGGEVVATSRSGTGGTRPCDLTDSEQVSALVSQADPDTVIHLAGGMAADRWSLFETNVLTTLHLLRGLEPAGKGPYCIVIGSAAEYGEPIEQPIPETAALRPVTDYGRAKVAETRLARALADRIGLPLTIVRPFNVVAAEMPAVSPLGNLRRQLLEGAGTRRRVVHGRLDVVRDFVPLPAVVEALAALVERPLPGETLNVCSGFGIALGEVLDAMARRLGVAVDLAPDPSLVALPAAGQVIGDPSKTRRLLGLPGGRTARRRCRRAPGYLRAPTLSRDAMTEPAMGPRTSALKARMAARCAAIDGILGFERLRLPACTRCSKSGSSTKLAMRAPRAANRIHRRQSP